MPPVTRQAAKQWRGRLEDAETLAREFPALGEALTRPESRRRLLSLMAASLALGGLGGCSDPSAPDGHYVPAVNQPPDIIPGVENHYATAVLEGGTAAGIVVTQEMGRPVKVEGNPLHPASLGATSAQGQALVLDFYDPDRGAGVMRGGQIATWQALLSACQAQRAALDANHGATFRILTSRVVSPSLGAAIDRLLKRYPEARCHQWEAVSRDNTARGIELAYGRALDLLPRVDAADVILALESDLISGAPGHLRHARDFASRRNPARGKMSRVYAAEPAPTLIGTAADHRVIAGPRDMNAVLTSLAAAVLGGTASHDTQPWVRAAAADLVAAGPRSLVHAGPDMSAEAHALVHQINAKLGGLGTTFELIEPVAWRTESETAGMDDLLAAMRGGKVETLLILDTNPAYAMPGFAEALPHVKFSLLTGPAPNETGRAATWYVPGTHVFEAWGDVQAHDGTVSIQQPQALPLYGGFSPLEILALLDTEMPVTGKELVRQAWRDRLDDAGWRDALANGVVPNTASQPVQATARPISAMPGITTPEAKDLTLLLRPDPSLGDGRQANNPWLQELPRPLGKLVWDNPLLLAPAAARRLGLRSGDEVSLSVGPVNANAPVFLLPGMAEDCALAWMGGGRTSAGAVGNGVGTDFMRFRSGGRALVLRKTGRSIPLASTDHHNPLEVDGKTVDTVVRHATMAAFMAQKDFARRMDVTPSIYHSRQTTGTAWGMSVDLNACIGCNACVIACQAENNVPVVGKDQVLVGREMHWLRIDRYYEGSEENPASLLQPMLCMHCEDAPCEPVCPVGASVHDSEGLNLQVYNRCIGTRFCSNNCPYKVRRFNFGAWAEEEIRPPISRNPDVSVRARGVMEKCTFCVQRIAKARIAHDRDGVKEQVVTACQAACPTQVFTFGDINDASSEVAKRKQSPLDYALLADQNTHPRLTFEARVTNPNPDVQS